MEGISICHNEISHLLQGLMFVIREIPIYMYKERGMEDVCRVPSLPEFQGIPRNLIIIFKELEIPWNLKKYMENWEKLLKADCYQIYI